MRPTMAMLLAAAAAVTLSMSAYAGMQGDKASDGRPPNMGAFACPDCKSLGMEAGTCEHCGKAMKDVKVLGTQGGEASVCGCSAACTHCDAKGVKDGKCACGKDVNKVSVKGHYVCADGCAEISKSAGKCACGKDLVKAE